MSFLKSPTEIPLTKIYNFNKFGQNTSQKLPSICEALCMWILTPRRTLKIREDTGDRSISNPKTRKQKGLGVHSQRPHTPSCLDAQGTEGHERHGSSRRAPAGSQPVSPSPWQPHVFKEFHCFVKLLQKNSCTI